MKILLLTGNHPRHLYFADTISKQDLDINWVIEKRESMIPTPDNDLNHELKKLFKYHFEKREEVENIFFGKNAGDFGKTQIRTIQEIDNLDLYNGRLKKICVDVKPDLLLGYGSDMIPENIINIPNMKKWNIHLGLSPWYRGAATHFWPSYLLEPEFTGITVHEMTNIVDGGPIIHQQLANLNFKDGIHENASRLTKSFCDKFPKKLFDNIKNKNKLEGLKQLTSGRNFTDKLWKPTMLRVIYELFEDRINKYCIENKTLRKPKIKSILI